MTNNHFEHDRDALRFSVAAVLFLVMLSLMAAFLVSLAMRASMDQCSRGMPSHTPPAQSDATPRTAFRLI